jgi:hypothetical protein
MSSNVHGRFSSNVSRLICTIVVGTSNVLVSIECESFRGRLLTLFVLNSNVHLLRLDMCRYEQVETRKNQSNVSVLFPCCCPCRVDVRSSQFIEQIVQIVILFEKRIGCCRRVLVARRGWLVNVGTHVRVQFDWQRTCRVQFGFSRLCRRVVVVCHQGALE